MESSLHCSTSATASSAAANNARANWRASPRGEHVGIVKASHADVSLDAAIGVLAADDRESDVGVGCRSLNKSVSDLRSGEGGLRVPHANRLRGQRRWAWDDQ
jgi:hypothetical protein